MDVPDYDNSSEDEKNHPKKVAKKTQLNYLRGWN